MWPNSGNQGGNPIPYLVQQDQIDNGDQEGNVSGSGRLNRAVSYASMVSAADSVALPIAMDPGLPTSSRLPQMGMGSTEYENSVFSQEIFSQTRNHMNQVDISLRDYNNRIIQGISQKLNKYWLAQLYSTQEIAMRQIMGKQAEIDNANVRISEMEQRISNFSLENQNLSNLVLQLQALEFKLKEELRNSLSQNTAAPPLAIEGCGDNINGVSPFIVNDEQSSAESQDNIPRRLICKVCLVKEICIVILHCRHLCLCEECESKVDLCPVCNNLKSGTAQIFIP